MLQTSLPTNSKPNKRCCPKAHAGPGNMPDPQSCATAPGGEKPEKTPAADGPNIPLHTHARIQGRGQCKVHPHLLVKRNAREGRTNQMANKPADKHQTLQTLCVPYALARLSGRLVAARGARYGSKSSGG